MSTPTTETTTCDTPHSTVLVDAHVHLYDCFDRVFFFDSALTNFRRAALGLGLPVDTHGYLLFAEMARDHAFESLIAQHELDDGRWRFHPVSESRSLVASLEGRDVMTIISGRQIVTREGLEVLALCSNEHFADGRSLTHTVEKVIESGALPVLPYGVGKWTGVRGVLVNELLNSPLGSRLLLGDNAGRLRWGDEPRQFSEARSRGVWILPGTDPLPFASQARTPGSYGMVLTGLIDTQHPADSIKNLIETAYNQPTIYGHTQGLINFVLLQTGMQLRKRLKR